MINRSVGVFIGSEILFWASSMAVGAFLSVLVTTKITDGDLKAVGLSASIYLLSRAILAIPFSLLIHRFSNEQKKNIVGWGMVIYGVVIIGVGLSSRVMELYVLQAVLGAFDALFYPIRWSIFGRILDKGREEMGWAVHDSITSLTSSAFVAVIGAVAMGVGLVPIFVILGIIYSLSGIIFNFIDLEKR